MKFLLVAISLLTMMSSWASDKCRVELIDPNQQITEEDMHKKGYELGESPIKLYVNASANCITGRGGNCGFDANVRITDTERNEVIYSKWKWASAPWIPGIGWISISREQYLRSIRKLIPKCSELLNNF